MPTSGDVDDPIARQARWLQCFNGRRVSQMYFQDRYDGGRRLAKRLRQYATQPEVLVLALPRGGVPVGSEVARALCAPLDVFLVRKLGVPGHEELAMGAVASGGVRVLNHEVIEHLHVPPRVIDRVTREQQRELERREQEYRGNRARPAIRDRTVIVVDDGLATGSTMRAACSALRAQSPTQLVVAVPVAAPETCADLGIDADRVVCFITPQPFYAVGVWYRDFAETTDEEVKALLTEAGASASVR
jgi:putative phosphoribosyl transferase